MPTPTLPIATLSTANTFRAWLERTNTIIDLINSGSILISAAANGAPVGVFAIGNTSETTSSLTIAGGKFFANATGITLTGTSVFGANVTINASAANVVFSSNATYLLSNTTFVGGANLYVNTAVTVNGTLTLTSATTLTVSGNASFGANATFSANLVASNTVYVRSIVYNRSDSVVAATISSTQYDNYALSGLDDAIALNLNPDTANVSITGISAPANMSAGVRVLYLQNTNATNKLTLRDSNTSSSASNRFSTPGGVDIDVLPMASIPLLYSFSTNRWRLLAGASDSSTQSRLTVSGNVSVGGALTVTGNTTLTGNTTFSSNVVIDTDVLFVDTVNNRIGINTATPDRALQVVGAAIISGAANLSSTLGITGAVNALSTLGITGAVNALSTFGVSGNATLSANVYANTVSANTGATKYLYTDKIVAYGDTAFSSNTYVYGTFTPAGVTETVNALGTVGSTQTLSITTATTITATLTAGTTTTFTLPAPVTGKSFMIYVTQVGSGTAGNAAWSTPSGSIKWPSNGSAPTITTTNGRVDIFSFVSNGTNWYASYIQNY